jgi:hypothetical protein
MDRWLSEQDRAEFDRRNALQAKSYAIFMLEEKRRREKIVVNELPPNKSGTSYD